jgi:lysophospholipase L1-like esterase
MSMRTLFHLISALAIAAGLASTAQAQNVRVLGRSEPVANGGFAIQWPGSGFEVSLRGSKLTAQIEDWGSNWLNVEANGKVTQIALKEGSWEYTLFDGAPGQHTIKVTRRTGTPVGITRILDVSGDGPMLPTEASSRRIMVIGDSVTSGYGVEGEDQSCRYSHATQNHDLAYPALAAAAFNADIHTIAADGRGLVRNFAGTEPTMADVAWQELPDSTTKWAKLAFRPHVIVINLGAADFAAGDPGDRFDAAYVGVIETLRQTYLRPLHDRVVVRRVKEEEKSKGGIIIPDTAKEKPQEGDRRRRRQRCPRRRQRNRPAWTSSRRPRPVRQMVGHRSHDRRRRPADHEGKRHHGRSREVSSTPHSF